MQVVKRIARYVTANINALLDQAEDPERMAKQLIRDIEESIAEVRRETVRAVARQKQLEKQIEVAAAAMRDFEDKAKLALSCGEEALAREAIRKKLQMAQLQATTEQEIGGARDLAARMKSDLARLEDQVQVARRKRDELVRRRQAAAAQLRTQEAARRSTEAIRQVATAAASSAFADTGLDVYEASVLGLEAQAEAERELLDDVALAGPALQKLADDAAIDAELRRLKGT